MAEKYDLIVIGGGPGGYTAALRAAGLGFRTAVVEKDKMGGACLNRGCIPTKALLYASHMFASLQSCDDMGVSTDFISFDFKKMQEYKRKSVITYQEGLRKLFQEAGIDVIRGRGTLRRGKTVEVIGEEGKVFYEADHIILASGAVPRKLTVDGADSCSVLTSDELLASKTWNYDRLTIIGGGVIGVEFATIFNNLQSKVTLIEQNETLLGTMDREVSLQLQKELERKGITVHCDTVVEKIEKDGSVCLVRKGKETFEVRSTRILAAVGRDPYMEGLLGEDVSLDRKDGRLAVDGNFMTSEPGVYAIGDLISPIRLAHVAAAQASYVVDKLAGREPDVRLSVVPNGMYAELPVVPSCIYTEPEIATVGITEEMAKAMGLHVKCGHYDMRNNGKSIIAREEGGFVRLIFEAYSNTIVGAQIICSRATDMIGEMATAIANGLTASQLSMAMRAHPTYGEGIAAAIEDAMKERRNYDGE